MIHIHKEYENSLLVILDIEEGVLANADAFKAELIKLFDQHHKRIVLNLEQMEYMDSSFLGALVSALKHVIALRSDIVLVGLRKDIAELFALIRLDKVFKIYSNFKETPVYC
jgi:anti-sigma B factor antagonist